MQTSESNILRRVRADWFVALVLFLVSFFIFFRTLAPSVAYLFDDSLEFQLLASRMAIAHPTGYPLYSILIKLATFLPFGDVAYRVNLVSALSGAGAVLFVFLAARLLTEKFFTANNFIGEILTRAPALIAALILAFGETFWSQAVIAEVYALQALLTAAMLWLVLRWGLSNVEQLALNKVKGQTSSDTFHVSLITISFFAGLILTHHRLAVLLYPALIVYVLSYERAFLKQPKMLLKIAAAFALPLLLYLYLPIRGMVTSSLDGAYQNTADGFLNWILGTAYTVFVTQNPFNQTRDAAYYGALFVNDFGAWGLLAALIGFVALFLRAWREWVLLTLALFANLAFVLTYRVADINVFFIPTFVIVALYVAAGLAGLLWVAYYALPHRVATMAASVGAIVLLLVPFALLREHYARVDLSNKRDVYEYGASLVTDRNLPVSGSPAVIGILGEMSLIRYFQDTLGWGTQLETIAADKEDARMAAVDNVLNQNRRAYLTRPLAGIEKKYSLSAIGHLVLVRREPIREKPSSSFAIPNVKYDGVTLIGYDAEANDQQMQVTLAWHVDQKIRSDRFISLKLLNETGGRAAQLDRRPVLDAYPTTAWRKGEYIFDTYTIPFLIGATPGEYTLQVTMYDPASGQVFGQTEVGRVNVAARTESVARELLGMQNTPLRDLGGIELSGFDFDGSEAFGAGANVPLTLLWRMMQNGAAREYDVTLMDQFGQVVKTQNGIVGGANFLAGQYARQELELRLPQNLAAGKYTVRVMVRGGLPFWTNSLTLGTLEALAQ